MIRPRWTTLIAQGFGAGLNSIPTGFNFYNDNVSNNNGWCCGLPKPAGRPDGRGFPPGLGIDLGVQRAGFSRESER